jgi:hypothetical protein
MLFAPIFHGDRPEAVRNGCNFEIMAVFIRLASGRNYVGEIFATDTIRRKRENGSLVTFDQ